MVMLRRFISTAAVFILALLFTSTTLNAQLSTSATVTGIVTDANGAVIPGASVTITDILTKVATHSQTNGDGGYVVPDLNVGTYSVTITKTGFKSYTVTGIELHPTETFTVNGTLSIGAANETVTVAAASPDVETSSPELSSYIDTEQVSSLPVNGRNFQGMAALMPGVVNTSQGSALGTGGRNTSSALVINGMTVARTFYALECGTRTPAT